MKRHKNEGLEAQIRAIMAIPDEEIDTSDIPELTEEQFRRGVRGRMYRPVKKPVTMRLDADVLEWLKKGGPGYQTKVNWLLRTAMMRSCAGRKTLKRDARPRGQRQKSKSTRQ